MSEEFAKVRVDLEPDAEGYPPVGAETIWTTPCQEPDIYRVDSIPVFAHDLAVGDMIRVRREGDESIFDEVVASGGHSTVWIIVEDDRMDDHAWRTELREFLRGMGCESEWDDVHGIIAVDVPANASIDAIEARLADEEARGNAEYAHACLRH
jgi:hypothetical protein